MSSGDEEEDAAPGDSSSPRIGGRGDRKRATGIDVQASSQHYSFANGNRAAQRLIVWAAFLGASLVSVISAYPVTRAFLRSDQWLIDIYRLHFAATVGLPAVAALAFLLVITLEARFDRIEMEFFGIVRFAGGAGPIIMWAFCFLVMAGAVKLL